MVSREAPANTNQAGGIRRAEAHGRVSRSVVSRGTKRPRRLARARHAIRQPVERTIQPRTTRWRVTTATRMASLGAAT
eukprot:2206904-Alexandrium_andersonii.AAC.1